MTFTAAAAPLLNNIIVVSILLAGRTIRVFSLHLLSIAAACPLWLTWQEHCHISQIALCLFAFCKHAQTTNNASNPSRNGYLKRRRSSALSPLLSTPQHIPLEIIIHVPTMSTPQTNTAAPPASHKLLKNDLDSIVTRVDKYAREEIEKKISLKYAPKEDEHDRGFLEHSLKTLKQRLDECRNLWMQGLDWYYQNTVAGDVEARRIVREAEEKLEKIDHMSIQWC